MYKEKVIKELYPQLLEQGHADGYATDTKLFQLKKGPHFGTWGGKLLMVDRGHETLIINTDTFIGSINNEVIIHADDNELKFWIIPIEYRLNLP